MSRTVRRGACPSLASIYYDVKRRLNTVVRGFTDRGDPVQVVGTEVLARCLQYETDHLDGVLFIDRDGRRDVELAMRESEHQRGCTGEDEQVSEDWPHILTSGAGDRTPVHFAWEAAGNWAKVWVLARNDSFNRGGWLPCGTELRGR
jgi:hypothetical protein